MTKADERLTGQGHTKLAGLLKAGDPDGGATTAWQAEEAIRQIHTHTDADLAVEHVECLVRDLRDTANPPEVRSLGHTLIRWRDQITAWHQSQVTNGPTEPVNNLTKRIKRVARVSTVP